MWLRGINLSNFENIAYSISTSMEQRMSSTVGQMSWTGAGPSFSFPNVDPACTEDANSSIHFSSKAPKDENCTQWVRCSPHSILFHQLKVD